MDGDTRDNGHIWPGTVFSARVRNWRSSFQQSYFRSLPPKEAIVAVVSTDILVFTEKETTKEVEEGMVMAKLEREPTTFAANADLEMV